MSHQAQFAIFLLTVAVVGLLVVFLIHWLSAKGTSKKPQIHKENVPVPKSMESLLQEIMENIPKNESANGETDDLHIGNR